MARLSGYTKNRSGAVLGGCTCSLFKDNLNSTCSFVAQVTSDPVTGQYIFTGITDTLPQYFVVSWKDDSPHVFDTTDHVLTPNADSGDIGSVGVGDEQMAGASGAGGAASMDGAGTLSMQIIDGSAGAFVTAAGAGDEQMVGAAASVADASIAGVGDEQMVGGPVASGAASMDGAGGQSMIPNGQGLASMSGTGTLTMVSNSGGTTLTSTATDDFNRGDAATLGANWTAETPPFEFHIASFAAQPSYGNDCADSYNAVAGADWQYAEITYVNTSADGAGAGNGPACHFTSGIGTFIRAVGNASGYELIRFNLTISTVLKNGTGTTFAAGDKLLLAYRASTGAWFLMKNRVQFDSGTDGSPVAAGRMGIAHSSTSSAGSDVDAWEGGTVS